MGSSLSETNKRDVALYVVIPKITYMLVHVYSVWKNEEDNQWNIIDLCLMLVCPGRVNGF